MSINLKVEQQIALVCFDNSEQANCFSLQEAKELQAILNKIEKERINGLVFYSSQGRNFCSGGALSDYAQMSTKEQGLEVNQKITTILNHLSELSCLTVCCVEGNCLGGGVELISAFDTILSAPQSLFALWQRKIGLSFGWGGGRRLIDRLGSQKVRQLALEARLISSYEALELGLVDQIVPESMLLPKAVFEIKKSAHWPQGPVKGLKKFNADNEQELFASLWMQPEHQAVLNKWKK